jgi:hypothetical protein
MFQSFVKTQLQMISDHSVQEEFDICRLTSELYAVFLFWSLYFHMGTRTEFYV